ncbi:hypothetical protein BDW42DRAFT_148782 [Aspergillus taichungensis]|uniref:Uncharacterized protein n=1 Tax=Aspergillus taichungensis TaxID=482145 RepID=A0A2J5HLP8_9EURO|nr:hypothetical protein BDW42DRAFT_148782 [Aspergillus taichungensis]
MWTVTATTGLISRRGLAVSWRCRMWSIREMRRGVCMSGAVCSAVESTFGRDWWFLVMLHQRTTPCAASALIWAMPVGCHSGPVPIPISPGTPQLGKRGTDWD